MKLKIISINIIVLLTLLILTFLFLETMARNQREVQLFNIQGQLSSLTFYPRPYVMSVAEPNKADHNSLGYRGSLPSLEKRKDEKRIFILGGSTVYNGTPPFSEILESKIQQTHSNNFHVYNFGAVTSVTTQDVVRILVDIYDYTPDLIIMYGGFNDFYIEREQVGYPHAYSAYENNPLLKYNVAEYPTIDLILFSSAYLRKILYSHFLNTFFQNLSINTDLDKLMEKKVLHYFTYIQKAHSLAKAINSKIVVFFQPVAAYKKQLSKTEIEFNPRINYFNKIRSLVRRDSKKLPQNVKFIDMSDIFDNNTETVFVDEVHNTQPYMEPIADSIFNHINQNNLLN